MFIIPRTMKFFLKLFVGIVLTTILSFHESHIAEDDSEYRDLLLYDSSLHSLISEFDMQSMYNDGVTNYSNAVNFANIAIMYHERDKRWNQGGTSDALVYINRAIEYSDIPNDLINETPLLKHALTLHKGLLLTELGFSKQALAIFNSLLLNSSSSNEMGSSQSNRSLHLSSRDISSVLYHKADVMLTQYHNSSAAVELLQQAVTLYPCNYNAYLKLIMALKELDGSSEVQIDWLQWRHTLEVALSSIEQVSPSSIAFVATSSVDTDGITSSSSKNRSALCVYEEQDLATSISSLNNIVHINIIRGAFYAALHLVSDAAGDYSIAWKYLQQGRHVDRYMASKVSQFSLERNVKQAAHAISYFQPGYWPPAHLATKDNMMGSASRLPVFIVGFFRSGSTLLESMLDAHPSVWGMGESSPFGFQMYAMQDHMRQAIRDIHAGSVDVDSSDDQNTAYGDAVLLSGDTEKDHGRHRRNNRVALTDDELSDAFSSPYAGIVKEHANKVLAAMKEAYREAAVRLRNISQWDREHGQDDAVPSEAEEKKVTRIVDKMLANYYNIGVIHLMFPRAIILHTVRDPLDTLFSCYKNRFGDPATTYTLNFHSLVRQYTLYLEIVAHFRKVLPNVYVTRNSDDSGKRKQVPPMKALVDVRYEELVANPERVMRRVLSLIGLPYDERVLQHHKRTRNVHTASVLQVKKSIYHHSVGQWRTYSKQLNETLVPELRRELSKLKAKGVLLPYAHAHNSSNNGDVAVMNWGLSDKFNYTEMIDRLRDSG